MRRYSTRMTQFFGETHLQPFISLDGTDPERVPAAIYLDDQCHESQPGSPWRALDPVWLERLLSRPLLRDFCRRHEIPTSSGEVATSFDDLSKKVIRMNRFPLALKSCRNGSDGDGVFRLEGFRELSRFYDIIQKNQPGPVLIEDWVNADARLEITKGPQGFSQIVQVGLEASLRGRTAWRLFPVTVPGSIKPAIEAALDHFAPLLTASALLVRFSFAVSRNAIQLLSMNGGWNRLEYFPGWTAPLGLPSLFDQRPPTPADVRPQPKRYARLQFFHQHPKKQSWSTAGLGTLKSPPARSETDEKMLVVLMGGESPAGLSEQAKLVRHALATET